MTLKRGSLFLGTKLEILGHQFYAQLWTKIRSILHARESAQATLHPHKEIFKLKETRSEPELNA